jgi:DNA gyrase inhibitor GyrI
MYTKLLIAGLVLAVVTALIMVGCSSIRAGYESAPYRVLRADGAFELREYPKLVLVQTPMGGANDSFMKLFRYIGGQNAATQKISMTTPVFMSGSETNGAMSFVMPKTMRPEDVPQPTGANVSVGSIAPGQFAVLRFSGTRNARNETDALAQLTAWLKRQNLQPNGDPIFAYFDPPWTPPFLRRNEVMLRTLPAK